MAQLTTADHPPLSATSDGRDDSGPPSQCTQANAASLPASCRQLHSTSTQQCVGTSRHYTDGWTDRQTGGM